MLNKHTFLLILFGIFSKLQASTIIINPSIVGNISDVVDVRAGSFNVESTSSNLKSISAILEFPLLFPSESVISSAILNLNVTGASRTNGSRPILTFAIFGYSGDGVLSFNDVTAGEQIAGPFNASWSTTVLSRPDLSSVDITEFLQEELDAGSSYAGIAIVPQTYSGFGRFTLNLSNQDRPTIGYDREVELRVTVVPEPSPLVYSLLLVFCSLIIRRRA